MWFFDAAVLTGLDGHFVRDCYSHQKGEVAHASYVCTLVRIRGCNITYVCERIPLDALSVEPVTRGRRGVAPGGEIHMGALGLVPKTGEKLGEPYLVEGG